jgi:hypothetical protein
MAEQECPARHAGSRQEKVQRSGKRFPHGNTRCP